MHDQRIGRLVGKFRAGQRAHLQAIARVGQRVLVGALDQAQTLDADRKARGIHHREHRHQAAVRLADQPAFGAVEVHHAGDRSLDAHLVLDRAAGHAVAFAHLSTFVNFILRHDEQRDALDAGRRVRQAREHEVHDVLGQVVLAGGDEDLRAADRGKCRPPAARPWTCSRPRSEPQCGSVRHIVPVQRPSTIGLRNAWRCHSSPCWRSASDAPCESSGKLPQDRFAESSISFSGAPIDSGRCWPP